jgi:hypothetical protein
VEEDEVSVPADTSANDEIARVAYAIWEAEGQPDGRDHEHWMRARQLIEEGRAEEEFPQATAARDEGAGAPRPVQPGFEDAAPGMVPVMKDEPGAELREGPGGRFAKQLSELPERAPDAASADHGMPGPQDPDPAPATNAGGYVAVPSSEEVAGGAVEDHPKPLVPEPPSAPRQAKVAAAP